MKIICLVKFVPKVDDFKYDTERNILVREDVPLIINPDDACALEFALQMKDKNTDVIIEVVSMGPVQLQSKLADLLRRNVDVATLISDKKYVGSDSFVTAKILSTYLKTRPFDLILSGSQTLDGDTGHVGPQVGELLNLSQYSNIVKIEEISLFEAIVKVDDDDRFLILGLPLPALLSVSKESKYKLRFVKATHMNQDVSERLFMITNDELQLKDSYIGLKGSPTKVKMTFVKERGLKKSVHVKCDDAGIEKVHGFLKKMGVI